MKRPTAYKVIDQCQDRLLNLHIELNGLSALFKNMADCELTSDELHGVGLSLERVANEISDNLQRISVALNSEN